MDGAAPDLKHQSRQLTEGPERAAARAYLHGIGFDEIPRDTSRVIFFPRAAGGSV